MTKFKIEKADYGWRLFVFLGSPDYKIPGRIVFKIVKNYTGGICPVDSLLAAVLGSNSIIRVF